MEGAEEIMKPELIIIAGPNGSGKTSLTEQLIHERWIGDDMTYINPDNIAQDEYGSWNTEEAVVKAAIRAEQLRRECLEKEQSFAFETVFSADEKIKFLKEAVLKGYFIRLFFVSTTSPEINSARVARRVLEGGHSVPIEKIISRYAKSIANCEVVAGLVDRLYVYDNSINDKDPSILFRSESGALKKQYQDVVPEWSERILGSLKTQKNTFNSPSMP